MLRKCTSNEETVIELTPEINLIMVENGGWIFPDILRRVIKERDQKKRFKSFSYFPPKHCNKGGELFPISINIDNSAILVDDAKQS